MLSMTADDYGWRAEQEKELKSFRESLKTEVKLLKQEVELLPKERRKEES